MKNWFVGLLIIGLVSIIGCQPAGKDRQAAPGEVRVAVAGPFTGANAAFGTMIKRGAQLKAKEINEAGGINGMKFSLEFEDDTGKEKEAIHVATKISTNPRILAVVGHFNSACSLRGKTIYGRKGIVALSPGSTNVNVCQGSDWMFRNLYRDDFQAAFIAKYIKNVLTDLKAVAVFYDNDAYGKGLADAFIAEAETNRT